MEFDASGDLLEREKRVEASGDGAGAQHHDGAEPEPTRVLTPQESEDDLLPSDRVRDAADDTKDESATDQLEKGIVPQDDDLIPSVQDTKIPHSPTNSKLGDSEALPPSKQQRNVSLDDSDDLITQQNNESFLAKVGTSETTTHGESEAEQPGGKATDTHTLEPDLSSADDLLPTVEVSTATHANENELESHTKPDDILFSHNTLEEQLPETDHGLSPNITTRSLIPQSRPVSRNSRPGSRTSRPISRNSRPVSRAHTATDELEGPVDETKIEETIPEAVEIIEERAYVERPLDGTAEAEQYHPREGHLSTRDEFATTEDAREFDEHSEHGHGAVTDSFTQEVHIKVESDKGPPTPEEEQPVSDEEPPMPQFSRTSTKAFTTTPRAGDLFIGFTYKPESDPYADRLCHVNSAALCIASEAFSRILQERGFYNGTMEKVYCDGLIEPILDLNGDPVTFRQVLKILHHRNNYVRPYMSYEAMVELAMIAVEYEIRQSLQIWAELWAKELERQSKASGQAPFGLDWITVCWVFGLNDLSKTAGSLISRAYEDEDSGLLYFLEPKGGETMLLDIRTHPQIIDELTKTRVAYVHRLRVEFIKIYEAARMGQHQCFFPSHQRECKAMQFGDISMQATEIGLLDDTFWLQSLEFIVERIGSLQPLYLPEFGENKPHTLCSWVDPMQIKAEKILKLAHSPVVSKNRGESMFNVSLNWEKVAKLDLA